MKKSDILKGSNLDLLCQLGSEFLKNLERIGVEAVLVSDHELKRVIIKMIEDNDSAVQLEKDRAKEKKQMAKQNA